MQLRQLEERLWPARDTLAGALPPTLAAPSTGSMPAPVRGRVGLDPVAPAHAAGRTRTRTFLE